MLRIVPLDSHDALAGIDLKIPFLGNDRHSDHSFLAALVFLAGDIYQLVALALGEFRQFVHFEHQQSADRADRGNQALRVPGNRCWHDGLTAPRHAQNRLAGLVARHEVFQRRDKTISRIAGKHVLLLTIPYHRAAKFGAIGWLEP